MLYISGGKSRKEKQQKGIIVQLDPCSGESKIVATHQSSSEVEAANGRILFKSCTLYNKKLYVCTETEIIVYDTLDWKQVNHISIKRFNDVHHVLPINEKEMLIANTGLDMIMEISATGCILNEWSVVEKEKYKKFPLTTDYRKLQTQPHQSHPNYIFNHQGEIWVTRFQQKDAICISNTDKKIAINIGSPHDGNIYNDKVYFTTVNGYIVSANLKNYQIENVYDLNKIQPTEYNIGWCRGLHIIDKNLVLVGFSRLRPTKFIENLKWLRYKINNSKHIGVAPTRICLYNLASQKIEWEYNFEEIGLSSIFSIIPSKKMSKNDFKTSTMAIHPLG